MAITESEFDRAFREAVSSEFKDVPLNEEEIDYTFSHKFNKKMDKLICSEKKSYWRFVNTAYKKAILVAVIIAIMLSCVLSVSAVRKSIINFIVEIYETHFSFKIDGEGANEILYEYHFSSTPEGFKEINVLKNPASIQYEYINDIGEIIKLEQNPAGGLVGSTIDNEHGTLSEITVKDLKVYIYVRDPKSYVPEVGGYTSAQWLTEDGYALEISYEGNIDLDTMIALIESVE